MEKERNVDYHKLIFKFLSEEISDSELIQLKSWLALDASNRRIFDEENELWHQTSIRTKLDHFKPDTAWIIISKKLGLGKNNRNPGIMVSKNNYRLLIAAASVACLLALSGLGLYAELKASLRNMPAPPVSVVATNEGEKSHLFLSDSTRIILNSGSSIQYDGNYNIKDRVVKLKGEAYFEVQTNPEKPFIVNAGKVIISATGTRFNILSYDDENRIETTLIEGKIQVSVPGKEPINVIAGQQVVYYKNSEKILLHDAIPDIYTSWKENKLRFYDTPFEEAMRGICRRYNVKIDITNRDLLNIRYTATFIDEPIDKVMQLLRAVSPITYKIYNQTTINDSTYIKPRIVIGLRKQ